MSVGGHAPINPESVVSMRLLTLGGLTLEVDGTVVTGALTQRRRLAIMVVLAQAGNRGVARDRVVAMLWPESDARQAGHVLAQLLYAARRDLGGAAMVTGNKTLRLNPEVITADSIQFEAALAAGHLAEALDLYKGVFLDGFHLPGSPAFEDWLAGERERLAAEASRAGVSLATGAAERGELEEATRWWRWVIAHDPWAGQPVLALAGVLAEAGDRVGAIRVLEAHGERLQRDLELPPDPAVTARLAELRSG